MTNNAAISSLTKIPQSIHILNALAGTLTNSSDPDKICNKLDDIARRVISLKKEEEAPALSQEISQIKSSLEEACVSLDPLNRGIRAIIEDLQDLIDQMQAAATNDSKAILEKLKLDLISDEKPEDTIRRLGTVLINLELLPEAIGAINEILKIRKLLESVETNSSGKSGKQSLDLEDLMKPLKILQVTLQSAYKNCLGRIAIDTTKPVNPYVPQTVEEHNNDDFSARALKFAIDDLLVFYPKSCKALIELFHAIENGQYGEDAKELLADGDLSFFQREFLLKLLTFHFFRTNPNASHPDILFIPTEDVEKFNELKLTLRQMEPEIFFHSLSDDDNRTVQKLNQFVSSFKQDNIFDNALIQLPSEVKKVLLNPQSANSTTAFKFFLVLEQTKQATNCFELLPEDGKNAALLHRASLFCLNNEVKQGMEILQQLPDNLLEEAFPEISQRAFNKYLREGRWELAIGVMKELLVLKSKLPKLNPSVYSMKPICHGILESLVKKGKLPDAIQCFEEMPFLESFHHVWFNFQIASYAYSKGKNDEASTYLKKAISFISNGLYETETLKMIIIDILKLDSGFEAFLSAYFGSVIRQPNCDFRLLVKELRILVHFLKLEPFHQLQESIGAALTENWLNNGHFKDIPSAIWDSLFVYMSPRLCYELFLAYGNVGNGKKATKYLNYFLDQINIRSLKLADYLQAQNIDLIDFSQNLIKYEEALITSNLFETITVGPNSQINDQILYAAISCLPSHHETDKANKAFERIVSVFLRTPNQFMCKVILSIEDASLKNKIVLAIYERLLRADKFRDVVDMTNLIGNLSLDATEANKSLELLYESLSALGSSLAPIDHWPVCKIIKYILESSPPMVDNPNLLLLLNYLRGRRVNIAYLFAKPKTQ